MELRSASAGVDPRPTGARSRTDRGKDEWSVGSAIPACNRLEAVSVPIGDETTGARRREVRADDQEIGTGVLLEQASPGGLRLGAVGVGEPLGLRPLHRVVREVAGDQRVLAT